MPKPKWFGIKNITQQHMKKQLGVHQHPKVFRDEYIYLMSCRPAYSGQAMKTPAAFHGLSANGAQAPLLCTTTSLPSLPTTSSPFPTYAHTE